MRVPESYSNWKRNRRSIWFIIKIQIINHKALETLPMATTRPSYTKLTCPSPTTGARGLPRFHAGDEVHDTARDPSFARKLEEAQVVPFHLLPHLHRRNRKERRHYQAYSLLQTTMEPLPHGLWSCSSKPLTGRTGQAEGRFSYWKHHEPQPVPQEDSTGQGLIARRR